MRDNLVLGLGVEGQCRCPEDDVCLRMVSEQAPRTGTEDKLDGDLSILGISVLNLSFLSTEESVFGETVSENHTYLCDYHHNNVVWQI